MKKFNDSKLYFYFSIITVFLAIITGGISGYSRFFVEKKVAVLLNDEKNFEKSYREAYLVLRNPQLFALYENFDSQGEIVKRTLSYFDNKVYRKEAMKKEDRKYLELLFDRRQRGSRLGFNSAVFLVVISFVGFIMFIVEKRQARRE